MLWLCAQTWGNPGEEFPRWASIAVHRRNRYSTELSAGKEAWTCDEVYHLRCGLSAALIYLFTWYTMMVSCLYICCIQGDQKCDATLIAHIFKSLEQSCEMIKFFNRLIARLIFINFFNHALITVSMHILFVTFFNLFVFHLHIDIVGPLLLNASLLLVLMTDYSDWLVPVTELIDNAESFEFWRLYWTDWLN